MDAVISDSHAPSRQMERVYSIAMAVYTECDEREGMEPEEADRRVQAVCRMRGVNYEDLVDLIISRHKE